VRYRKDGTGQRKGRGSEGVPPPVQLPICPRPLREAAPLGPVPGAMKELRERGTGAPPSLPCAYPALAFKGATAQGDGCTWGSPPASS